MYKCLGDLTRLRILGLLLDGPLCVCHIQAVLGLREPVVSRQLGLLKRHGLVESEQQHNWRIYRISPRPTPVWENNLQYLRAHRDGLPEFCRDLERRREVIARVFSDERCRPAATAMLRDCAAPARTPSLPAKPISLPPEGRSQKTKNNNENLSQKTP